MVKLTVKIVSMQDADKFNKLCSKFDCDMNLQSGKYYVDAKSIMGNIQSGSQQTADSECRYRR